MNTMKKNDDDEEKMMMKMMKSNMIKIMKNMKMMIDRSFSRTTAQSSYGLSFILCFRSQGMES